MSENTINTIGLKEAAELAGTNRNYLLKLINAGKLPGEKVQRGDTEVTEWRIPRDAVEAWASNKGSRTNVGHPGASKYTVYMTPEQVEAAIAIGLEPVKVTYKGKTNKVATVDEPNVASPEHTPDEVGSESAPKRTRKGKKISEAAAELFES